MGRGTRTEPSPRPPSSEPTLALLGSATVGQCIWRQHPSSDGSHIGDSQCTDQLAPWAHRWSAAGVVPALLEIDMAQNNQNQQNQQNQDQRNERNQQQQQQNQRDERNQQNQQNERNER